MFVQVIVDIKSSSVDKKYYYKIPTHYIGKDLLGYRVEVPFGSRTIQGYVVNQIEELTYDTSKIKTIKSIKDDFPVLTKELILLSENMADDLYCTQIQVIEALLPTILKVKYKEYYKLLDANKILDYKKYFSPQDVIEKNKLEKMIDKEIIKNLLSEKIIKLVSFSTEQLKDDYEKTIILSDQQITSKLTPKQKILVDYLKENKAIKKSAIKQDLQISSDVVNRLLKNNVVKEILKKEEIFINKNIYQNEKQLNTEQLLVFNTIKENVLAHKFDEFLIHGVTGSGKTEVYINLIKACIDQNKEAILLIPEIVLTPQIQNRFRKVFGENLAVIHSNLSKKEKFEEWKKIKDKKVQICLGTRSAVFAPFENLGLIIIDEEHESSYKQNDTPRYETKNIAKKRAVYSKSTLVYASATPSVDLYYHFEITKKNNILNLKNRFNNTPPEIQVVSLENKEEIITKDLLQEIKNTIHKNEQVLLFINKRGYTNFIRCFSCGHIYKCDYCDISLNYHKSNHTLQCHFCGFTKSISTIEKCCKAPELVSGVLGIQKVEEYLKNELPEARIIRMDSDTTAKKGAYEKILSDFENKKADILLGTQMISKGLDFPDITLVGILSLDSLVAFPSFKSNEKIFQLLLQTAGRAGRSDKKGKVFIQSSVESNIIDYALENNYKKFYEYEINRRKIINYPPFCRVSYLTIKGEDETKVSRLAVTIYNFIYKHFNKENILGPSKALIYKVKNEYIYHIAIKFDDVEYKKLHKILNYINDYFKDTYKKDKISINIDNFAQDFV